MIEQILSIELINALGWTLVHTLWQAALFAVLLGLALVLLRKYSARTRYVVAIGVLCAFCVTTVLTFAQLYQGPAAISATTTTIEPAASTGTPSLAEPTTDVAEITISTAPETSVATTSGASVSTSFWNRMITYYDTHLPLIVTLWLMGVLILQLRFLGQLAFLQRLKNYGTERFPARLAPMLQELEDRLGITKPVRYLTSFRVSSPFTAGWLRPAVLFPGGLLGELDEAQLRTIIAHELAHIKRYDFLVNLIQTLLCILFFYHPAVWWISARIDEEREHCCDDLAIEATGEPVGYARTLLQLKEAELSNSSLAMGFFGKGDGFKDRITRLLSGYLGTGTYGEGFTTAVIIFCFMGLAITLSGQQVETELGADAGAMDRVEAKAAPVPPAAPPPPHPPGRQHLPPGKGLSEAEAAEINTYLQDDLGRQFVQVAKAGDYIFEIFMDAIEEGDLQLVNYLIEKEDFDFTGTNAMGLTPLMLAASEDHPRIVRRLIDAGAEVDHVNAQGWTALIEAADEGSYASALVLLEAGADPNLKGDNNSRSALAMAASEGHTNLFALLIQNGADVFSVQGGTHPLHAAAEEGKLLAVRQLLELDADVNITDEYQRTPLSYAAEEGKGNVVQLLLENGAKPDIADRNGRTPLSYAAEEGKDEVVAMLLKVKADPNSKAENGWSPLDFAADELWDGGDTEGAYTLSEDRENALEQVIYRLVAAGATSESVELDGETIRIVRGQFMSREYDDQGSFDGGFNGRFDFDERFDFDDQDELNRALDQALDEMLDWLDDELEKLGPGKTFDTQTGFPRNKTVFSVWELLGKGASSDRIRPDKGWIESRDGKIAFPYILDRNAKVYDGNGGASVGGATRNPGAGRAVNNGNPTSLHGKGPFNRKATDRLVKAVAEDDIDNYDSFLKDGADINGTDRDGYTPLTVASRENHNVDTYRLLELGANINETDDWGYTPLTQAAKHNHFNVVRTLLEKGADPDLADKNGNTAKEIALRDGSLRVITLLNEAGASVTANDADGTSPLIIPAREGYQEVLRYLLEQGASPNATRQGPTPLFLAAREGQEDAVRILTEYGASLETRQDYYDNDFFRREVPGGGGTAALYDGGTALMIALTQRSANVVRALLVAGADVNAACNKVRYTGKKALEAWNAKMMTETELSKRYQLTYRATGWTPLMEAAESGNINLVKLLLDNGADKRRKTSEGTSAYDVATTNGFMQIAALLK